MRNCALCLREKIQEIQKGCEAAASFGNSISCLFTLLILSFFSLLFSDEPSPMRITCLWSRDPGNAPVYAPHEAIIPQLVGAKVEQRKAIVIGHSLSIPQSLRAGFVFCDTTVPKQTWVPVLLDSLPEFVCPRHPGTTMKVYTVTDVSAWCFTCEAFLIFFFLIHSQNAGSH
jgi:hypothetical protein